MRIRIVLSSLILAAFAVLHGLVATMGWAPFWMKVCSAVFAAGYIAAAGLLIKRVFWARWLVQGIGVVGLLNCAAIFTLWGGGATSMGPPLMLALQSGGFIALLALMTGRQMVTTYDEKPSPYNRWSFDTRAMKVLRAAVVLNIAVLPMLFKHIGAAACPMFTTGVTVVLLAAIVLVVLQRTAGILLLAVAGVGTTLLAFSAGGSLFNMLASPPHFGCGYSAWAYHMRVIETAMVSTAFVPGALGALAAVLAFTGPMARFLKRG